MLEFISFIRHQNWRTLNYNHDFSYPKYIEGNVTTGSELGTSVWLACARLSVHAVFVFFLFAIRCPHYLGA